MSALLLRSFLFIFSANNLKDGKQHNFKSPTPFMGWNQEQVCFLMFNRVVYDFSLHVAEMFVLALHLCLTWPLWCC